jgi:hypothetical protein
MEIWVMDSDGANLQQVTHSTTVDSYAYWVPNRASAPVSKQELVLKTNDG